MGSLMKKLSFLILFSSILKPSLSQQSINNFVQLGCNGGITQNNKLVPLSKKIVDSYASKGYLNLVSSDNETALSCALKSYLSTQTPDLKTTINNLLKLYFILTPEGKKIVYSDINLPVSPSHSALDLLAQVFNLTPNNKNVTKWLKRIFKNSVSDQPKISSVTTLELLLLWAASSNQVNNLVIEIFNSVPKNFVQANSSELLTWAIKQGVNASKLVNFLSNNGAVINNTTTLKAVLIWAVENGLFGNGNISNFQAQTEEDIDSIIASKVIPGSNSSLFNWAMTYKTQKNIRTNVTDLSLTQALVNLGALPASRSNLLKELLVFAITNNNYELAQSVLNKILELEISNSKSASKIVAPLTLVQGKALRNLISKQKSFTSSQKSKWLELIYSYYTSFNCSTSVIRDKSQTISTTNVSDCSSCKKKHQTCVQVTGQKVSAGRTQK